MIIKKLPVNEDEEELFDSFIQKGGKSTDENKETSLEEDEPFVRFSLRVPESLVHAIDKHRKKRFGRISRNLWIIEAIVKFIEE